MNAAGGTGRRTIVKVCGLTNLADAKAAVAAGADWLGFIVRASSPRLVDPSKAGEIVAALPGVVTVAVMTSVTPQQALDAARRAGAARVQLHRVDPEAWPADFPLPCAFASSVDGEGAINGTLPPEPHLVLLDTAHATLEGGTGRTFPWTAARALAAARAVMLAGGLDGGNVGEAIRAARPFGVDASSRLESEPGFKDHDQVRRFVAAVRECDAASAGAA